jgi:hypothetical protein
MLNWTSQHEDAFLTSVLDGGEWLPSLPGRFIPVLRGPSTHLHSCFVIADNQSENRTRNLVFRLRLSRYSSVPQYKFWYSTFKCSLTLVCNDRTKVWRISVSITSNPTEIQTRILQSTCHKHFHFITLLKLKLYSISVSSAESTTLNENQFGMLFDFV